MQLLPAGDQFGNQSGVQVIRLHAQPSPAGHATGGGGGQPQQIVIQQPPQLHIGGGARSQPQPQQQQQQQPPSRGHAAVASSASASAAATAAAAAADAAAALNRPVPHRFRNLTDEQIARRRKANADRSRRRRAQESTEQRAERNRRTAERMRQRRAKIAEERGIVRTEPRTTTLSADRFEEIYQSVVKRNAEESAKEAHIGGGGGGDVHRIANEQQQQQHVNGIPTSLSSNTVVHMIAQPPHQAATQPVLIAQPYRSHNAADGAQGGYIYQTTVATQSGQRAPQQILLQSVS